LAVLLFSLWGKQFALQEDSMAGQTSFRSLKSIAGAGAFVLGFFLLFVNLDGFGALLNHAVGAPAETVGILPALGLASLHAVHSYTFDESGFLSSLLKILVSFWPLLLIVVGAALLTSAFGARLAKSGVVATSSGERAFQ
jgi:hypothetical protein